MKLSDLLPIEAALDKLSLVTETSVLEIIDALVGVCFNEEDAGGLREMTKPIE